MKKHLIKKMAAMYIPLPGRCLRWLHTKICTELSTEIVKKYRQRCGNQFPWACVLAYVDSADLSYFKL